MDTDYSPRHSGPRHARRPEPAVDLAELIQLCDELTVHMERLRRENDVPPAAFAVYDHFLRVVGRGLRGTSYRGEVEVLIDALNQYAEWRHSQGQDPSRYAGLRNRMFDVLSRLAATLPERPSRGADLGEDVAWSVEAMTMTVEGFAHAIGKSPRTVYRMARMGQLLVYRDGVGRGTMLIYRDQVDPANRPQLSAKAK